MTYLVERLAELRKHLDHLRELAPRTSAAALERDLTLHNDVLFSLLTVCQLVIDIAGDLSARNGMLFEDYTQAVRNLGALGVADDDTLPELEKLPGFRNVLVHEYVRLDFERVVEALERLDPLESFVEQVRRAIETSGR